MSEVMVCDNCGKRYVFGEGEWLKVERTGTMMVGFVDPAIHGPFDFCGWACVREWRGVGSNGEVARIEAAAKPV